MAGLYIEMPEEPSSRQESHSRSQFPDRIAYLISQYPTLSHSFILSEILELRKLGVAVTVASIRAPDRPISQLSHIEQDEARCVFYVRHNVWRWPWLHIRAALLWPGRYWQALSVAVRSARGDLSRTVRHLRFFGEAVVVSEWVRSTDCDRLHTHFASMTAMLAERLSSVRLSITIHGSDEFIDPVGFCMKEKLRKAQLAIGISHYGCSQIMRFCDPSDWHKVSMVRLGIDPDQFVPRLEPRAGGTFRVISVGRLVPVKAQRFLLLACAALMGQGEPVFLTIVGGGPELQALAEYSRSLGISDRVEFTGALPNAEVRERVGNSDCFALASFAEGVPVVLMEAMALGIPCVATRVTGVPELIEDGREGLLVPPADSIALTEAIRCLVHDPELCARFSEAGRRKVETEYNIRKNVAVLRDYLFERKPS